MTTATTPAGELRSPAAEYYSKKLESFSFRGQKIPVRMHGGIVRYLAAGIRPGDFLSAVLQNDLRGSLGRADDENVELLHIYVAFFYMEAPMHCWGSKENYDSWIAADRSATRTNSEDQL